MRGMYFEAAGWINGGCSTTWLLQPLMKSQYTWVWSSLEEKSCTLFTALWLNHETGSGRCWNQTYSFRRFLWVFSFFLLDLTGLTSLQISYASKTRSAAAHWRTHGNKRVKNFTQGQHLSRGSSRWVTAGDEQKLFYWAMSPPIRCSPHCFTVFLFPVQWRCPNSQLVTSQEASEALSTWSCGSPDDVATAQSSAVTVRRVEKCNFQK